MNNLLLLIQCKDSVGLVTNITRILAEHQLNIIAMREFVDEAAQQFFTRIECSGSVEESTILTTELLSHLPPAAIVKLVPKAEKSIAVLVTKEFHCLSDILIRDHFKTLGANVKCVIGNHTTLKELVEKLGGEIVQCNFIMELTFLHGKEKIGEYQVYSPLKY